MILFAVLGIFCSASARAAMNPQDLQRFKSAVSQLSASLLPVTAFALIHLSSSCKKNDTQFDAGGSDATSDQSESFDSVYLTGAYDQTIKNGATDPGPRASANTSGDPLPGLTANELEFFEAGKDEFAVTDSVTGSIANTGSGLGRRTRRVQNRSLVGPRRTSFLSP